MDPRTGLSTQPMTVATHEFAFRNLLCESHIGIRHHLRHIQMLVIQMIEVKHASSVFGDEKTTINTLGSVKFGLEEASTSRRKILLLVARPTIH